MTAAEVKSLDAGKYADGDGLWLVKRQDGGAQWTFRFTLWGRPRETGLGSLRHVSLREARLLAEEVRRQVRDGIDPIKARRIEQGKLRRVESTLGAIAVAAYEVHRKTLKNNGEDGKWFSPLRLYILPKLGRMPIAKIDQHDIKDTLQNAWIERHESARKALSRLMVVYQHAVALNHDVDLQIIEKAKVLLGKSAPQSRNIPAMDWAEVPSFYRTLGDTCAVELALRMLILTGVRSASVRNLKFEQIDGNIWTIPAENVKGRRGLTKPFDVPMSNEALHVGQLQSDDVAVFPLFSPSACSRQPGTERITV
ncbi:tyrosine-type recombinase/integrase [Thalassovita gelatinovora]|uniref:tyrosine-type recombinase/integrase n=1 Tax=Thalassovita gelatinovora TaxID=53501 RepID=UPI00071C695A|nr:integrase arm-type DNA-binding domain-containing protein [Thalassovita gelatinovora]